MSVEQIKQELASLPEEQQNELAAFLVHLRHKRNPLHADELAGRIDDADPAHWLSLDQLKEHWKD